MLVEGTSNDLVEEGDDARNKNGSCMILLRSFLCRHEVSGGQRWEENSLRMCE